MKKLVVVVGILLVLGVVAWSSVAIAGGSYNHLVKLSQAVDSQWAQVQNVYQRRADLIPNLVATVSGAANFEKSTLTEITEARASVGQVKVDPNAAPTDPAKLAEFDRAQGQLCSALSRLLVVSERYPDLTATANFRDLQAQLEGTENRISVERGRFNEAVQAYDTAIKSFPERCSTPACLASRRNPISPRRRARKHRPSAVRFQQDLSPRRHEPMNVKRSGSILVLLGCGCLRVRWCPAEVIPPSRPSISTTTPRRLSRHCVSMNQTLEDFERKPLRARSSWQFIRRCSRIRRSRITRCAWRGIMEGGTESQRQWGGAVCFYPGPARNVYTGRLRTRERVPDALCKRIIER